MEIKLYADKVYAVEYAEMNGQRWSGGDGRDSDKGTVMKYA